MLRNEGLAIASTYLIGEWTDIGADQGFVRAIRNS